MAETLGPQQAEALDAVARWHKQCVIEMKAGKPLSEPIFRLFGYAGTGKTFLARRFAGLLNGSTVYCAFTGKAAMVMRKSGCDGAATIHSIMYSVKSDEESGSRKFRWNPDSALKDAMLIVTDECSMVGTEMGLEMMRYKRPILALGDPAQLGPVQTTRDAKDGGGAGFFTECEPDFMLTEIRRQAEENPIIFLSKCVREGHSLRMGRFGDSKVIAKKDVDQSEIMAADQVLVGMNRTRDLYNRRMRELLLRRGFMPEKGDRLVCLKNNSTSGIFNGGLFIVDSAERRTNIEKMEGLMSMHVQSLDVDGMAAIKVKCRIECWDGDLKQVDWRLKRGTDEFDYGYALTVHKSQGSGWPHVVAFDESGAFRTDAKRWLYTAITRASERLTLVM